MINKSKITQKTLTAQVAGLLPGDSNIEFIGLKETKQVIWLQHGRSLEWCHLPKSIYDICKKQYLKDKKAVSYLQLECTAVNRQVELYVYHLYGDIDHLPDYLNGRLTISENFRDTKNTPALDWDSKHITIEDVELNERDLKIIDLILDDEKDETIAAALGITVSTLAFHKKNLFVKVNVQSKTGLIIAVLNHHV